MDGLERLNALPQPAAEAELLQCCGSREWSRRMAAARPFASREALLERADEIWWSLGEADWLEAFAAHPRIGEHAAGADRHAAWSAQEQAGANAAAEDVRVALAAENRRYEERFGHVYLVCATGRSAEEMLRLLRERMSNDPQTELRVAAEEQRRITRLRLEKLLSR